MWDPKKKTKYETENAQVIINCHEKGVILPIESALQGLSGIKEMRSKASRDLANIELDIEPSQDINEIMARIEDRISSILNFPDDLEKPSVSKFEDAKRRPDCMFNYAWKENQS